MGCVLILADDDSVLVLDINGVCLASTFLFLRKRSFAYSYQYFGLLHYLKFVIIITYSVYHLHFSINSMMNEV